MASRPRPDHIRIGRIVGAHGIQGGIKVEPLTHFIERFDPGSRIYVHGKPLTIKRLTFHKSQIRLETKEITDRNAAEDLQWSDITVPASEMPEFGDDEYLASDLVGMNAVTEDGTPLGPVAEVRVSPAHDLLIIGNAMVPMVKEFVRDIDLDRKVITIRPIPGLFEE